MAHFQKVIDWVEHTFTKYRKEMKGVDWGVLYRIHHDKDLDAAALENEVSRLMADSDVQRKPRIYAYTLDGDERHLSIRAFDANTKREVYERQKGICARCGKKFDIEQMEADHINPWSKVGWLTKTLKGTFADEKHSLLFPVSHINTILSKEK